MNNRLNIVILAAGKGTRMKSTLPKVLHPLAGKPLLEHCYLTVKDLGDSLIQIVYGYGGDEVRSTLSHLDVNWVEQKEQLGTGHAVQQTVTSIEDNDHVLILCGDVPLLTTETLESLLGEVTDSTLALLTVELSDPTGYGRIIRNEHNKVLKIIEHKDATDAQRAIREVNTGILAVRGNLLKNWLQKLQSNNAQGEFYLTDVIGMAVDDGISIATQSPSSEVEILGVNNKCQLSFLERAYQAKQAEKLMESGVTLYDPARFDVRGDLQAGSDVVIDINAVFEGKVVLGDRVVIGPNCTIKNTSIADDVVIQANTVIEDAEIGARCRIGPFARIRPETQLADEVHIGNFVEIKKSDIAGNSKINHLAYVGDSSIGARVNIGAGTITCNYDGANKHKTIIEDDVFIGSDTQLVAPVTVKKGATIGAGSTITREAPEERLTLSRSKQTTIKGWKRPKKN